METTPSAATPSADHSVPAARAPHGDAPERQVIAKVSRHLLWFLFILFSLYLLSGPTRPLWTRRRVEQAQVLEKGI